MASVEAQKAEGMTPLITEELWMVFLKSTDERIPCSSASELRARLEEVVLLKVNGWRPNKGCWIRGPSCATGAFPEKETLREALTLLHPNSAVLFSYVSQSS